MRLNMKLVTFSQKVVEMTKWMDQEIPLAVGTYIAEGSIRARIEEVEFVPATLSFDIELKNYKLTDSQVAAVINELIGHGWKQIK